MYAIRSYYGLSEQEAMEEGYEIEVCHNIKPDKPSYFNVITSYSIHYTKLYEVLQNIGLRLWKIVRSQK